QAVADGGANRRRIGKSCFARSTVTIHAGELLFTWFFARPSAAGSRALIAGSLKTKGEKRMGRPYDQIQVTGIELAQRAQQIAKQKAISFGDALYEARREMEFADTVQRNTGSPLRDQAASTTPQPSAVREAVNAGLMAVAPAWKPGGDIGAWLATSAQRDIQAGGRSVAARLQGLGLGPQITASLVAELEKFLNNLAAG